ncbi:hypothetical protein MJI46_32535, partial [Salmonella enterica subsp. enterica serovar Cerro]|nr:hypothetical protein [Salmonella enterica subsp. enterica serovar Cerro]
QTNSGLRYRRFPFLATLRERAGPVTWIVMLACVVVYIAMSLIQTSEKDLAPDSFAVHPCHHSLQVLRLLCAEFVARKPEKGHRH